MKPSGAAFALIGAALLALGLQLIGPGRARPYEFLPDAVIDSGGCQLPVTELRNRSGIRLGKAIVFHGLSANRRIMRPLGESLAAAGWDVYLLDLPGHGDNAEAFTFARVEQCARAAVNAIAPRAGSPGMVTVYVGHSMGAETAVRLADHFPATATVALSPAPMVLPQRLPPNLLITASQFDLTSVKRSARVLLQAAGGERAAPEDFRELRAVKLDWIATATHSSILFDPRVAGLTVSWAGKTANAPPSQLYFPSVALLGAQVGLVGLMFLFPVATTLVGKTLRLGAPEPSSEAAGVARPLVCWLVASFFASGVLRFWHPLGWVGLFGGDYIASFLLVTGLALLALLRKSAQEAMKLSPSEAVMAVGMGFLAIVVFGGWLNWQMSDAWPNGARWLRLAVLIPICLPYFLVEEVALGPPRSGAQGRRFALFFSLRFVVWAVQVAAYYLLASSNILIVLLALFLALFSIAQRLAADAVRRRTGSAVATALFSAILAGWFAAVIFPLR